MFAEIGYDFVAQAPPPLTSHRPFVYHRRLMRRVIIPVILTLATLTLPTSGSASASFERAKRSTVQIVAFKHGTDEAVSRASGVVVNEAGWVLTNHHVVFSGYGYLDILVMPTGADEKPDTGCAYRIDTGGVIRALNDDDAALVIPRPGDVRCRVEHFLPPVAAVIETGENVTALGYPGVNVGGESLTTTNGRIAGYAEKDGRLQFLKIDAQIGPGSSGGPVIDARGRLVGLAAGGTELKIADGLVQNLVGLVVPGKNIVQSFPEIEGPPAPASSASSASPPPASSARPAVRRAPRDVRPGLWYTDAVQLFTALGYIDPSERFRPAAEATRGEFLGLVVGLLGGPHMTKHRRISFDDIPRTHPLYNLFDEAGRLGLVKGAGDCYGTHPCFAEPGAKINRAEAAALLLRAFGLEPKGAVPRFRDNPSDQWFTESINAAARLCILRGDAGDEGPAPAVRPAAPMLRAEMIMMLLRLHQHLAYPSCVHEGVLRIPPAPDSAAPSTEETSSQKEQASSSPPPAQGDPSSSNLCTLRAWECIVNSFCARATTLQTQKCTLIDRTCVNPNRAKPPVELKCNPLEGQMKKMYEQIDHGDALIKLMAEQILTLASSFFDDARQTRSEYETKLNEYKGHLEGIYKYKNYLTIFREAIEVLERDMEAIENRFFNIPGTARPPS